MASPLPHDVTTREFEGRILVRRFTDQLPGDNELERQTKAAEAEMEEEEEAEEHRRLKQLYYGPENDKASAPDFKIADIATAELQKLVDELHQKEKQSVIQRMGFKRNSSKRQPKDTLKDLAQSGVTVEDLKATVSNLEEEWVKSNGPVYRAFQRVCRTLDAHTNIFKVFPSESMYTSVLCSSLSCLVRAARNHSDIAEVLSDSIARISENVTRCSRILDIFKNPEVIQKLADIYALMFRFYHNAMEWYMKSKIGKAILSFNESLKAEFEEKDQELHTHIEELYHEADIGNYARTAMTQGEVVALRKELRRQRQNPQAMMPHLMAGQRMVVFLVDGWKDSDHASHLRLEHASKYRPLATDSSSRVEDVKISGITREKARVYGPILGKFIIGDEGPALLTTGRFWVAEDEVLPKLRTWMTENTTSRTLWISSPDDPSDGIPSAQAAAMAVVSAAWQAETPIISHFCQRPRRDKTREGMTIEQVGLLGLVYSLISQLLQFSGDDDQLDVSEDCFGVLNGKKESWDAALQVLQALLSRTPVLMFCVIDSLNSLEYGERESLKWCSQVLDILRTRQQQEGTVFNILLTSAGQSRALASLGLKDRHITTRKAREVARVGRRIEL
ncbi:hypothetical protein B0T25DRAFT_263212 [Lasiosphaeria hispida]|uniref:DUF7708 domain-containing protein n=1 Tax=Lasiosphaeria hispida TaxID=260671 RepID=A0AAJ0HG81_9PEZI|nr:hypothetical protein B0T25DRAFT_263212 [Lasiosphaeria hispida]